jgi:hypothetical protein
VNTSPMAADVVVATTTENLAAFGWFALSSLDSRTLIANEAARKSCYVSELRTFESS